VETSGIEPPTPGLQSRCPTDTSGNQQQLTASTSPACTAACTRKPEIAHETTGEGDVDQATNDAEPTTGEGADTLAVLAAALVGLSAADRAKLAAMLLAGNDSTGDGKTSTGKRGTRNKKG